MPTPRRRRAAFAAAPIIMIFCGLETFGTAMYMPFAVSRVFDYRLDRHLIGTISPAAAQSVTTKTSASSVELFAGGPLCNWVVCLATLT
jgi:formate/nitrite transporter FocA (FNT family)